MQLNIQLPFKAFNKVYLKEKISYNNIELFKQQLTQLVTIATDCCSEDALKEFITELYLVKSKTFYYYQQRNKRFEYTYRQRDYTN